jgi:tRNA(Ile)-lysidine synthase
LEVTALLPETGGMLDWSSVKTVFSDLAEAFDPAARQELLSTNGRPVLVACSGGADSIALLLALKALAEETKLRIIAAVFDHGQRPEAANEVAAVQQLCAELEVDCIAGKSVLTPGAGEAELRQSRYAWLGTVYDQYGAGALCLGQHADDVYESQLMAILRGSGPAGLSAPRAVNYFPGGQVRVRPFVHIPKAWLLAALQEAGIGWSEDASNANMAFTRNWIRREWVAAARERLGQQYLAGSQRTYALMTEAVEALDAVLRGLHLDLTNPGGFDASPLAKQPAGLCRRAFMAWWMRHGSEQVLSSEAVDAVVQCLAKQQSGKTISIGAGERFVLGTDHFLRLERIAREAFTEWKGFSFWNGLSGPLALPDGSLLKMEEREWQCGEDPYRAANVHCEAWLGQRLTRLGVRFWISGDRYRPLGAAGSRKLQDMFTDARIARCNRHRLPVITDTEGNILWVPGFPPADAVAVHPDCKTALRLTYHIP